MNTPITDAVAKRAFPDESADDYGGYVRMLEHARRLELDRAALMEALGEISAEFDALMRSRTYYQGGQNILDRARAALAAARANFP